MEQPLVRSGASKPRSKLIRVEDAPSCSVITCPSPKMQQRKQKQHKQTMAEREQKRNSRFDEQTRSAPSHDDDDDEDDDDDYTPSARGKKRVAPKGYFAKIRWTHVALLLLMTGTAVLPALLWVADKASGAIGTSNAFQKVGIQLGMMPTPKERLVKFYKKHNPEKTDEVDRLLTKYAGSYGEHFFSLARRKAAGAASSLRAPRALASATSRRDAVGGAARALRDIETPDASRAPHRQDDQGARIKVQRLWLLHRLGARLGLACSDAEGDEENTNQGEKTVEALCPMGRPKDRLQHLVELRVCREESALSRSPGRQAEEETAQQQQQQQQQQIFHAAVERRPHSTRASASGGSYRPSRQVCNPGPGSRDSDIRTRPLPLSPPLSLVASPSI